MAPAEVQLPEARRPKEAPMVSTTRILDRGLRDEIKRKVLRESLTRYRSELLDDEERMLLYDRIRRLRRELGLRS